MGAGFGREGFRRTLGDLHLMAPGWRYGFGKRAPDFVDKWFANGQSDINHFFGVDAEELYRTGEPASGSITGKIGGNVLSPATSPLYRQALTGDPGDPLGCGFDNNTTDSFDAADNGVHDVSTGAFAILVPFRMPVAVGGNNMVLVGKRDSNPYGYRLQCSNGAMLVFVQGAGGTRQVTVSPTWAFDTDEHYALFGASVTSDVVWAYSDFDGDRAGGTYSYCGNCSAAGVFSLGSCLDLNAAGVTLGPIIVFLGAAAEVVYANRGTDPDAWWAS